MPRFPVAREGPRHFRTYVYNPVFKDRAETSGPEGPFSARLLRFRSGTLRRPASSAGAETYASVFVSTTSFIEFVIDACCASDGGRHYGAVPRCPTQILPESSSRRRRSPHLKMWRPRGELRDPKVRSVLLPGFGSGCLAASCFGRRGAGSTLSSSFRQPLLSSLSSAPAARLMMNEGVAGGHPARLCNFQSRLREGPACTWACRLRQ